MAERRECWGEAEWRAYFRTLEWPEGEEPYWMARP